MLIFRKKNKRIDDTADTGDVGEVTERLQQCEQHQEFLFHVVRSLLLFLKRFALEVEEIRSDDFKKNMEMLGDTFGQEKNRTNVESIFEDKKECIQDYIDRQRKYIEDKERELKNIIELLTKALASIDQENEDYNRQIYQKSEEIEQITLLDDIKQMRRALQEEVEQIRTTVREKKEVDRKRIDSLSRQVSSLELELKRSQKEALRDQLTGHYSIAAFDRFLEKFLSRAAGRNSSFSLMVLEIDGFGKMKESYGEKISDRIELAIAQQAGKFFGDDDIVGRYGEGRFAVLLANQSLKSAAKQAKQLNKLIAKARYAVDDVHEGHVLSFTVSIGVSVARRDDTKEMLLDRAITALAEAQNAGRNRVASESAGMLVFVRAFFRRRLVLFQR